MALLDPPVALCPKCQKGFPLPPKSHPMKARIACPHCRARLEVLLGTRGQQKAEWAKK